MSPLTTVELSMLNLLLPIMSCIDDFFTRNNQIVYFEWYRLLCFKPDKDEKGIRH